MIKDAMRLYRYWQKNIIFRTFLNLPFTQIKAETPVDLELPQSSPLQQYLSLHLSPSDAQSPS